MNNPESSGHWFSARLRLACLIEGSGVSRYEDSVVLFYAADGTAAFRRALELGRSRERSFTNRYGERVAWKLKEVATLDRLASDDIDGVEVISDPIFDILPEDASLPIEHQFDPERSEPNVTLGVALDGNGRGPSEE